MEKIDKSYMSFAEGFLGTKGMHKGGMRQVDWAKVKEFIEAQKDNLKSVHVGLAEDWSHTSGEVWNSEDGYIPKEDTYVYASSVWATPSVDIEYNYGSSETVECWMYGGNSDSYFE